MFDFAELRAKVIAAPMAGGPSTPALVNAAAEVGALGFLAAGYTNPGTLRNEIDAVRTAGTRRFGVNIFVPESQPIDVAAVQQYRAALGDYAANLGVTLPDITSPVPDDDHFAAKIATVIEARVPVVTFTFGVPNPQVITALHMSDISIGITVTSVAEARQAAAAGADWLIIQGPEAGGHRSTFDRKAPTPTESLDVLMAEILKIVPLPVVAAGGITTPERANRLRMFGARAVQVGTALLRSPEAGTRPAHAAALAHAALKDAQLERNAARKGTRTRRSRSSKTSLSDPNTASETVVTRAFSGRAARALRNRFTDQFADAAVPEYPAVNTLTSGLRKASTSDPEGLNLWAGTGFRDIVAEPAAQILGKLG